MSDLRAERARANIQTSPMRVHGAGSGEVGISLPMVKPRGDPCGLPKWYLIIGLK